MKTLIKRTALAAMIGLSTPALASVAMSPTRRTTPCR